MKYELIDAASSNFAEFGEIVQEDTIAVKFLGGRWLLNPSIPEIAETLGWITNQNIWNMIFRSMEPGRLV